MSQRIVGVVAERDVIARGVCDVNRPPGLLLDRDPVRLQLRQQVRAIRGVNLEREHAMAEVVSIFDGEEPRLRICGARQREPDAAQTAARVEVSALA